MPRPNKEMAAIAMRPLIRSAVSVKPYRCAKGKSRAAVVGGGPPVGGDASEVSVTVAACLRVAVDCPVCAAHAQYGTTAAAAGGRGQRRTCLRGASLSSSLRESATRSLMMRSDTGVPSLIARTVGVCACARRKKERGERTKNEDKVKRRTHAAGASKARPWICVRKVSACQVARASTGPHLRGRPPARSAAGSRSGAIARRAARCCCSRWLARHRRKDRLEGSMGRKKRSRVKRQARIEGNGREGDCRLEGISKKGGRGQGHNARADEARSAAHL